MRTILDNELKQIREGIATLSARANNATAHAVDALIVRNYDEAREVKRDDKTTDQLRYEVENTCLFALATQQPVARDLRELVAATQVAVELERCGDYAKGVAKAARHIIRYDSGIQPHNLPDMDKFARDMLERSTNAFLNRDVDVARQVIMEDDAVDRLYNELLSQTMTDMTSNPSNIECGTWLLHAGHCLERIGDRATNIAERTIFVATGEVTGDLNIHPHEAARTLGTVSSD